MKPGAERHATTVSPREGRPEQPLFFSKALQLPLALFAVTLGGGLLVWLAANAIERNEVPRRDLAAVQREMDLQAHLREEVVRLRHGLSANYDALARLQNDLSASASDWMANASGPLAEKIAEYRHRLDLQIVMVDDFKFHNAVLQNSLRYFQFDALRLIEMLPVSQHDWQRELMLLVNLCLRQALGREQELTGTLRREITRLSSFDIGLPATQQRELRRLLAHAELIAEHQPVLDALTQRLIDGGPMAVLDGIEQRLRHAIAEEARRAAGYRALLSVVGVLLLIVTAMLGLRYLETLRRRLDDARELAIAGHFFEGSEQGLVITDEMGCIRRINPAFCRITGYTAEELIGQNPRLLKSGLLGDDFYREMWRTLIERGSWAGELVNRRKNGELYVQWLHVDRVRAPDGTVNYVGLSSDVTEIHAARERVAYLAYHDTLTGLPNRVSFQELTRDALIAARENGSRLAVLMLDLDDFKAVNESLGHQAGDGLLREASRRLREILSDQDVVARLGGDEFALLLRQAGGRHELEQLARQIIARLAQPCHVGDFDVVTNASIGVTLYPQDGDSAEQLLRNADSAMLRAKERGRRRVEFYTRSMTADAIDALRMQSALREAIRNQALELHYQPKFSVAGELAGAEALLRWCDDELGPVSPMRFVPIAERMGLIGELGLWALDEGCRQLVQWRAHRPDFALAVNVSPLQFREELVDEVASILTKHALPGEAIELEITESVLMRDIELTCAVLDRLKALGCRLAIDDFGTGYSSLAYLKRLPVDVLKIDKSFVDGLGRDANDSAVVRAIVALAESLDLALVAEGVENEEQLGELALLDRRGDLLLQGFLLARPMPAEKLTAMLGAGDGQCSG